MTDKLTIFDTTLRDGAQASGRQITPVEGVLIAKALEEAGVNVAEMPMATMEVNRRMIKSIIEATTDLELAAFVRDGAEGDIKDASEALDVAMRQGRGRIAMLTPTAECLRESKGVDKEEAMRRMVSGIQRAVEAFVSRGQAPNIQIYFEGASEVKDHSLMQALTRKALEKIKEFTPEQYHSKMKLTLDYADTHGTAGEGIDNWNEYGELHKKYSELVAYLAEEIGVANVVTAAHCHNDGLEAMHNSIKAYKAGAGQIDVTILGVGERAGNADIINVIYKLLRSNREKVTSVLAGELRHLAEVAGPIFGVNFEHHPVVGDETASTAAGIHADKIRQNPASYVKKDPSLVGAPAYLFKVGPAMGKSGVSGVLEEMGLHLPLAVCQLIYANYIKSLEDGNDINYKGVDGRLRFIKQFVYKNPEVVRNAELQNGHLIHLGDFDPKSRAPKKKGEKRRTYLDFSYEMHGEEFRGSGESEGGSLPIVQDEVTKRLGLDLSLEEGDWETYSTGKGADAEVVARVTLTCNRTGEKRTGYSIDGDEKIASVQAMLHAISSFPEVMERLENENV